MTRRDNLFPACAGTTISRADAKQSAIGNGCVIPGERERGPGSKLIGWIERAGLKTRGDYRR